MNPYFKDRKLNPVEDKPLAVKFSSDVWRDFNLHFKDKYPNLIKKNGDLNKNQIITKVVIDYLNSQCLERKPFNIDLLLLLDIEENYSLIGLRDDYKIFKNNSQNEYSESDRIVNEEFFESDKALQVEEAYKLISEDYFTEYYISSSDSDKPFNNIYEFTDYSEVNNPKTKNKLLHFRLNNYLDSFIDGVYKGRYSDSNIHKGLSMIQNIKGDITYLSYLWFYCLDDNKFKLESLEVLSEDDFISLVFNSDNEDLKDFIKSQKELKSEDLPTSEEIEIHKLKERISELEVTLNNTEKNIKKMSLENDNLKRQLNVYEADKEDSKNMVIDILKEHNAL